MRVKMILKKLCISLLIGLILMSSVSAGNLEMNYCFADSTSSEEQVNEMIEQNSTGLIGGILNAIASVFIAIFRGIRSINYYIAGAAGTTGGVTPGEITPFDIFFNRFTLLDANIFSFTDRDGYPLPTDQLVYNVRVHTAMWYYAVRTIAISIIAVMLIWNLVRALSKNTSVDQKVIAKNALTDWVLSFALIMFMHIIVIIVLNFNDEVLKAIQRFLLSSGTPGANSTDFFNALEGAVFAQNFILKVACLVVYALLNWQTFKYILVYVQRFLTIVLLVIISPIIPVTYSTDRMRGGKGAALNNWLRELLYNVFVQTLHAVLYAALVGIAMDALTTQSSITGMESLGNATVAIAALLFIKYAEKMLKTIFGFDSSQVINTNVFSNAVTTIGNVATSIGHAGQRLATPVARVANGGPLISFGQNVDGSHIGLGQLAQGAAYNAGRGIRSVGRTGVSFIRGIRGKDGVNGEANAIAEATATARAEGREDTKAEATATAENGETARAESEAHDGGGASPDEIKKDSEQDRRLRDLESENRNQEEQEDQELKAAKAQSMENLKGALEIGQKQKTEEEKKTVTEEHRTETTEEQTTVITEEHHEETEETEEATNPETKEEKDSKEPIPVPVSEGADSELLDKFKEEAKTILADDKDTLREWSVDIENKMDALEDKLDKETKDKILEDIYDETKNTRQVEDYIKSFENGSLERKYAEVIGQLRAYTKLDDETNLSHKAKLEALIEDYKTKGLEIPPEIAEMAALNSPAYIDSLQAIPKEEEKKEASDAATTVETTVETEETEKTTGTTGTEKPVENTNTETVPAEEKTNEETAEVESKGKGIVNLKDEAVKYAQTALLKLGVKAEDEIELQSDFQARYEAAASAIGMESPTMRDIIDNLSPEAQREYMNYKRGKLDLNAVVLEREAAAVRMLQDEARKEGFEMNVESTEYQGTVTLSGGKTVTFTAGSPRGVITNLEDIRKQQNEQNKKDKLA